MRVGIYLRSPHQHIQALVAESVFKGCQRLGDEPVIFGPSEGPVGCDVAVIFGIGGNAREYYDMYRANRVRVVFLDKGYTRTGHFRISVDSFQPLSYFQRYARPPDRWKALGITPRVYDLEKVTGDYVLFDGASNKYCQWNFLPNWYEWALQQVELIGENTDLPIIYRPRPSQHIKEAGRPIEGTVWSQGELDVDLARARVVVSHGGNIGFDSVVRGKPHFAIDLSIARPISETKWKNVGTPLFPSHQERMQWLYDIAYLQWSADELADGTGWRYIREILDLPT